MTCWHSRLSARCANAQRGAAQVRYPTWALAAAGILRQTCVVAIMYECVTDLDKSPVADLLQPRARPSDSRLSPENSLLYKYSAQKVWHHFDRNLVGPAQQRLA